jgi:hypothetical protein
MSEFKFSRRHFLQGSVMLAAFGAFPLSVASAATENNLSRHTSPTGYLARPLFFSNRQGVIVLPDAQAREIADKLARLGFTALVPAQLGSTPTEALQAIDTTAASLKQIVSKTHILGISGSGNLAVIAANRSATLDRVVILGDTLSQYVESSFAFEAPNRTNTLYLTLDAVNAEHTWARIARWLSNSGKAV